jgi:hypothetical protein
MNRKVNLPVLILVLVAGMFLAACGPIPAGAEIKVNADGNSAQVEFTGLVDSIAVDQWVVAGQTLVITPLTTLDATIVAGDKVRVHATATLDGTVTADSISRVTPKQASLPEPAPASPAKEVEFVGLVETIAADAWVVSGVTFGLSPQTQILGTLIVGDTVKVEALVNDDGTFTAKEIKLYDLGTGTPVPGPVGGELEMTGLVESIASDLWTISGVSFAITLQTEIKGTILVGDLVRIEARVGSDGIFTAHEIKLANTPGHTPELGSEFEFAGVVETIGPDSWGVSGMTFGITPQTEIKGTIIVGDQVKIEALVGTDGSFTAREIKRANGSNHSPEEGSELEFEGIVESIGPDSWTVAGKTLAITTHTEIEGTIVVGDTVKVEAVASPDGTLTAREICKAESHGSGNAGSANEDDDSHSGNGSSSGNRDTHGSDHGNGSSTEQEDDD